MRCHFVAEAHRDIASLVYTAVVAGALARHLLSDGRLPNKADAINARTNCLRVIEASTKSCIIQLSREGVEYPRCRETDLTNG